MELFKAIAALVAGTIGIILVVGLAWLLFLGIPVLLVAWIVSLFV